MSDSQSTAPVEPVSACVCFTWARLWEETQGGKYPPSQHHPNCPQYILKDFAVVCVDGACCVMHPDSVDDMIDGNDRSEYEISTVRLTQDQVDNMKEFDGF